MFANFHVAVLVLAIQPVNNGQVYITAAVRPVVSDRLGAAEINEVLPYSPATCYRVYTRIDNAVNK